ncbi:PTS transporter subunit EIIC [Pantoea sp. LMR881]|uniref:PTS sugar transporter subunit IIC n=1 Tax=Pantoea sp. LMR881 TaxID=3014336 RepID=UPI0022AEEF0A|nr:PTS transporter subunit EIIC [Pantoea sp. LMR881]MCZ4060605.1 PTS transporter subunit EIIC [Pantoea sp. LMR881]
MLTLLTLFGILAVLIETCFGSSLHQLVNQLLQAPLQHALQSLHGILGLLFSMNILWFFGIHGVSVMMPITEPTLLVAIQENAAALQQGTIPPHIVTKPFIDAFGFMGGGGQTIGLVIAMLIASRREDHRAITRLSGAPSLFNINEPMIFGIPIIFNPLLLVPFILVPMISVGIAWFATAMEMIDKTTVLIPWTTPPVISAFLATGGDWRAALLALLLLLLSVVIYLPFVLALNRQKTPV